MYNWRKRDIIISKQLAYGGNEMRKRVERIVLLVIIGFIIIKVMLAGHEFYTMASNMSNAHYDELEMLLQEEVR